ncbi:universal stress protein [Streptomyces axinellae]|uniref:universal stress protein n=1 Tax=Streptomyces axinellae TaxID=552788 RepID=UPI0031DDC086
MDVHAACEETLAFVFEAAERRSAPLKVLNGWEPPPTYGPRPMVLPGGAIDGVLAERAGALAKKVRPWGEKHPGVRVDARAVLAQPAELLLDASQEAALLVVGRRRRDASLGAHVGPVAHAAMHHAQAPVAVVPHP